MQYLCRVQGMYSQPTWPGNKARYMQMYSVVLYTRALTN